MGNKHHHKKKASPKVNITLAILLDGNSYTAAALDAYNNKLLHIEQAINEPHKDLSTIIDKVSKRFAQYNIEKKIIANSHEQFCLMPQHSGHDNEIAEHLRFLHQLPPADSISHQIYTWQGIAGAYTCASNVLNLQNDDTKIFHTQISLLASYWHTAKENTNCIFISTSFSIFTLTHFDKGILQHHVSYPMLSQDDVLYFLQKYLDAASLSNVALIVNGHKAESTKSMLQYYYTNVSLQVADNFWAAQNFKSDAEVATLIPLLSVLQYAHH